MREANFLKFLSFGILDSLKLTRNSARLPFADSSAYWQKAMRGATGVGLVQWWVEDGSRATSLPSDRARGVPDTLIGVKSHSGSCWELLGDHSALFHSSCVNNKYLLLLAVTTGSEPVRTGTVWKPRTGSGSVEARLENRLGTVGQRTQPVQTGTVSITRSS